jgi:hypothetical protein
MLKQNFLIVCLLIFPFYAWGLGSINTSYPNPELKANEIVSLQLMAMQQNDVSNHGIEITFRFASPQNKVQTGPLSNFITLVKSPSYHPLLNHIDATFLNLKVEGNVAIQEVIITTSKGTRKGFRFLLSLQQGEQFKNCWMTDAVVPFEILEV